MDGERPASAGRLLLAAHRFARTRVKSLASDRVARVARVRRITAIAPGEAFRCTDRIREPHIAAHLCVVQLRVRNVV